MSLLIARSQWLSWIQVFNCQFCNQCNVSTLKGQKSQGLSISLALFCQNCQNQQYQNYQKLSKSVKIILETIKLTQICKKCQSSLVLLSEQLSSSSISDIFGNYEYDYRKACPRGKRVWKEDCNTCWCTNGWPSCTRMFCTRDLEPLSLYSDIYASPRYYSDISESGGQYLQSLSKFHLIAKIVLRVYF